MASRYKEAGILEGRAARRNRFRARKSHLGTTQFSPFKKRIKYFTTPVLKHPTKGQRASIHKAQHIWRETDSFWKLAAHYYGDPVYWWIIAWYNQAPTESHLVAGEKIFIPTSLSHALQILRFNS